ncbi:MAG: hypothetical protein IKY66_07135 [Bacteroidales bacterium]|nr:hypothetical protein [Bacteroidales bacterium]
MRYNRSEYDTASVQVSSFETAGGTGEYHMMVHVAAEGSFEEQLQALHASYDDVASKINATPIFIRYFLSDAANQAEALKSASEERWNCAVSVIGQPPLDGSKVAMWAYLVSDVTDVRETDGIWSADYLGCRHLWFSNGCHCGGDSKAQTEMILDSYAQKIESKGCSIPDNCLRTWFFVQDVDTNYMGVVVGRKERFQQMGLTEKTHYLASTGIAGTNGYKDSLVSMDAYAVEGIPAEKVTYLKGSTHLNPTHEYGVTFERGTVVDFADRRHVLISGTASIDNRGQIVHPGDVRKQTLRMWENVEVLLAEAGCAYEDVVHMIVYLRDIADYASVRSMYEERFPQHPKVFVWAPVCRPGWLVEMECIAIK